MTSTYEINRASTQAELNDLLEDAAIERNCELSSDMTYLEQAEFFESEAPKAGNGEDKMLELAEILRAAESKWYELES